VKTDQLFVISRSGGKVLVFINMGIEESGELTVTNMLGQKMSDIAVSGQQTVELSSGLASGIYVVSLKAGLKFHSEKTIIRKE
jgi:hypothetical protein